MNLETHGAREKFRRDGYAIFRGIVPSVLIERAHARLPELRSILSEVRASRGRDREDRIQPLRDHAHLVDMAAFSDILFSRPVCEAIRTTLSRRHVLGRHLGVLLEPESGVEVLGWHRDSFPVGIPEFNENRYYTRLGNWRLLSQVALPLLDDSTFWIVRGSAGRRANADELRAIDHTAQATVLESECVSAVESAAALVPGAVNLQLVPGDLLLYRAASLHMSIRVAGRPRATLIDRPQCIRDLLYENHLVDLSRSKARP